MPDAMMITGLRSNAGGGGGFSPAKHSYGGYHNRKLQTAAESKAFIENLLTVPIVACGAADSVRSPGMSVGPGELVQLPEDGAFFVGLKGDSWRACASKSRMPWIIDLDAHNGTYSFAPHPMTGLLDQPLVYSLQLKCVSEEDDDCQSASSHSVKLSAGASGEVVFRVKSLSREQAGLSEEGDAYSWGHGVAQLLSPFLSSTLSS